jgi:hypothetical protein
MADPLIVAKDSVAPAYRRLAYMVFEWLPLENFGNRIPQLSFEVSRPIGRLEQMVSFTFGKWWSGIAYLGSVTRQCCPVMWRNGP